MSTLGKTIIIIVLLTISGCTLHFKASEVELESHGNTTYELDRIAFIEDGEPSPN